MAKDDNIGILILLGLAGGAVLLMSNSASAEPGTTTGANATANDGVNNPLNIRASNIAWQGKNTAAGKNFESFQNMWQGYRAGIVNLQSIFNQGNTTLTKMISVYAPQSDSNDVASYVSKLEAAAGIDPLNDDMTNLINDGPTMQAIITAMAQFEQPSGFVVNPVDVQTAWKNL